MSASIALDNAGSRSSNASQLSSLSCRSCCVRRRTLASDGKPSEVSLSPSPSSSPSSQASSEGAVAAVDPQCSYVRDMCEPSESVWKVAYTRETCAVLSRKAGKMVVEIWSFKPDAGARAMIQ